jgi:hypothetical protein
MECLELNYKVPTRVKKLRTNKWSVHIEEIGTELLTQDLWRYNSKDVWEQDMKAYRQRYGILETKIAEELPI